MRAVVALGGDVEFSFFVLTHATQAVLTHVDEENHRTTVSTAIQYVAPRIRAAGDRAILSSDSGVFLLPPPVEAFREQLLPVESEGLSAMEIRRMVRDNPADLFGITPEP